MNTNESTLGSLPVIFIDCQTTGATPQTGHLLEMGWSIFQPPALVKACSYLASLPADYTLPKQITRLTGITSDDLDSATSKEVIRNQILLDTQAHSPRLCVIHYARFERKFLLDLFDSSIPWPIVCTHEIARRLYHDLPSRGIKALAGYFGEPVDELKRAPQNITATQKIWQKLTPSLQNIGVNTEKQLFQWLEQTKPPKALKRNFPLPRDKRLSLPDRPGIYEMLNARGEILYVGKAGSLRNRVNSYFRGQKGRNTRHLELLTQVLDINVKETQTALEAALVEVDRIKSINPPYNSALRSKDVQPQFYSRDFTQSHNCWQPCTPIGPFPSEHTLSPLFSVLALHHDSETEISGFLASAPPDVLRAGVKQFFSDQQILRHFERSEESRTAPSASSTMTSMRSLLALGLHYMRLEEQIELEDDADLSDNLSEGENQDKHREIIWTPNLVARVIAGQCKHAAHALHRGKELHKLANSSISWKRKTPRHGWRTIILNQGEIYETLDHPSKRSIPKSYPIPPKDVIYSELIFSRLQVLYTELLRLIASKRQLHIHYSDGSEELY